MAETQSTTPEETADWDEFSQRHKGNPFLNCDPLYALTEPIIEALQAKVPGFFTAEQVGFERDLAKTASFGFFQHMAMGFTARESIPDLKTGQTRAQKTDVAMQSVQQMIGEDMQLNGLTSAEVNEYFEGQKEQWKLIALRKEAYVGWLVSNRQFWEEVEALQSRWHQEIQELGRFPSYPSWPNLEDRHVSPGLEEMFDTVFAFYRRWGLQRMLTWDWPIPMEPDLVGGILEKNDQLKEAGTMLFIPWYLIRGEKFDVREVVRRAREACHAQHLLDWVRPPSIGKSDDKGDVRYGYLSFLYRYHELVLMRRYPNECHRRLEQIDDAFAFVLGKTRDTLQPLRQELRKLFQIRRAAKSPPTASS